VPDFAPNPAQVRPSYVESSVQKKSTSSVAHHLLANYQRAHIAIIKAQFTSKRLANGMSVRPPQSLMIRTLIPVKTICGGAPGSAGLAHMFCCCVWQSILWSACTLTLVQHNCSRCQI
jgi:hypothetical protein